MFTTYDVITTLSVSVGNIIYHSQQFNVLGYLTFTTRQTRDPHMAAMNISEETVRQLGVGNANVH